MGFSPNSLSAGAGLIGAPSFLTLGPYLGQKTQLTYNTRGQKDEGAVVFNLCCVSIPRRSLPLRDINIIPKPRYCHYSVKFRARHVIKPILSPMPKIFTHITRDMPLKITYTKYEQELTSENRL